MIFNKKLLTLDQAVLGLVVILVMMIGLVLYVGSRAGVMVHIDVEENDQGPFKAVTLFFSVPVKKAEVESRFSIEPESEGRFEWLDSQTLRFVPAGLKPAASYQLTLQPGEIGANNEPLRQVKSWPFQTRPPLIIYTHSSDGKNELWVTGMDGEQPHRLVDTENAVFNYAVSPDGDFIILSLFNEQNRLDLWRVDRNGQNLLRLLDCGGGNCSTPAISPDGNRVAYTREANGITPNSSLGAPRIHILDLSDGQDSSLLSDSQMIGYGPVWSPDGKWVTSYDGLQDTIRAVSIASGEQVLLPSVIGSVLSWSPDSTRLAFTTVEESVTGLRTVIMLADFTTGEVTALIGRRDAFDFNYGALAWSPANEHELVIGLQPFPGDPSHFLWLVDLRHLGGSMFANEEDVAYQAPHWDPWGKALVFQKNQLKGAYHPEVVLWEPGMSSPRTLAEGFSPRWLP